VAQGNVDLNVVVRNQQAIGKLNRDLQSIQAQGLQDAFTTGAGLFEQDRGARMMQEQRMADELARIQQGGFDARLQALGMTGDMAAQLGRLGGAERQAVLEQSQLMRDIGADETAEQQALLSQDYQDFLRQQNYGREQLQWYGDLLRGNIRQGDMRTMDYANANPYQQLLGGGLGALGLSQGLG